MLAAVYLLDRWGVRRHLVVRDEFKSAVERLTHEKYSGPLRAATQQLLASMADSVTQVPRQHLIWFCTGQCMLGHQVLLRVRVRSMSAKSRGGWSSRSSMCEARHHLGSTAALKLIV